MNIFKKIAVAFATFALVLAPAIASANNGKAEAHAKGVGSFFSQFSLSLPSIKERNHEEGGFSLGLRMRGTATTTVEMRTMLHNIKNVWGTYRTAVHAAAKVEQASKQEARANFKAALKTAITNKDKSAMVGAFETFFSADAAAEAKFNDAQSAARATFVTDLKAILA